MRWRRIQGRKIGLPIERPDRMGQPRHLTTKLLEDPFLWKKDYSTDSRTEISHFSYRNSSNLLGSRSPVPEWSQFSCPCPVFRQTTVNPQLYLRSTAVFCPDLSSFFDFICNFQIQFNLPAKFEGYAVVKGYEKDSQCQMVCSIFFVIQTILSANQKVFRRWKSNAGFLRSRRFLRGYCSHIGTW